MRNYYEYLFKEHLRMLLLKKTLTMHTEFEWNTPRKIRERSKIHYGQSQAMESVKKIFRRQTRKL